MCIGSISALESIFARPAFAAAGERIANTGSGAGAIFGMNLLLPKADLVGGVRSTITKQALQALRPGERARFYIPIPNSIIRSPGNNRRMFLALSRTIFRGMRRSFMVWRRVEFFGGSVATRCGRWLFASLFFGSQSHASRRSNPMAERELVPCPCFCSAQIESACF